MLQNQTFMAPAADRFWERSCSARRGVPTPTRARLVMTRYESPFARTAATWSGFIQVRGCPNRFLLDLASHSPARTDSSVSSFSNPTISPTTKNIRHSGYSHASENMKLSEVSPLLQARSRWVSSTRPADGGTIPRAEHSPHINASVGSSENATSHSCAFSKSWTRIRLAADNW